MNKPQEIKYEIHAHEGCEKCYDIPAFARKIKVEKVRIEDGIVGNLDGVPIQDMLVKCKHGNKWLWGVPKDMVEAANQEPELFDCSCPEPITYGD